MIYGKPRALISAFHSSVTMASLVFQQSRNILLPAFRAPFSRPLLSAFLPLPTFLGGSFKLPSLASLLEELFPRILLAVPKKKVSHSRKAMRAANKGLKDKHSKLGIFVTSISFQYFITRSCPLSRMRKSKTRAPFMSNMLYFPS